MIITFDGPVASGKSTIARLLAEQLRFEYLNSGLLYRACAYIYFKEMHYSLDQLMDLHEQEVSELIKREQIHYSFSLEKGAQVFVRHAEITQYLKEPDIDRATSIFSTNAAVRQALLSYQRNFAQGKNIITDGRDTGTVIFPHADYKFYLTAAIEVRAQRWQRDQALKGNNFTLSECISIIKERDDRDMSRAIAPLSIASDAFIIDSSHVSVQEMITQISDIINK